MKGKKKERNNFKGRNLISGNFLMPVTSVREAKSSFLKLIESKSNQNQMTPNAETDFQGIFLATELQDILNAIVEIVPIGLSSKRDHPTRFNAPQKRGTRQPCLYVSIYTLYLPIDRYGMYNSGVRTRVGSQKITNHNVTSDHPRIYQNGLYNLDSHYLGQVFFFFSVFSQCDRNVF